jgi:hypothetical protein
MQGVAFRVALEPLRMGLDGDEDEGAAAYVALSVRF